MTSASPRLSAALAATLSAYAIGACAAPQDAFQGRWESGDPAVDGVIEGVPTLAIGQYGDEVAGVVFFRVDNGTAYRQECPCAVVEHRDMDREAGELVFETTCDPASPTAVWRLELSTDADDTYLEGTVSPADGSGVGVVSVRLRFRDDLIRDEDRQCPPAP